MCSSGPVGWPAVSSGDVRERTRGQAVPQPERRHHAVLGEGAHKKDALRGVTTPHLRKIHLFQHPQTRNLVWKSLLGCSLEELFFRTCFMPSNILSLLNGCYTLIYPNKFAWGDDQREPAVLQDPPGSISEVVSSNNAARLSFFSAPSVRWIWSLSSSPCRTATPSWWPLCTRPTPTWSSGRSSWLHIRRRRRGSETRWAPHPPTVIPVPIFWSWAHVQPAGQTQMDSCSRRDEDVGSAGGLVEPVHGHVPPEESVIDAGRGPRGLTLQ